jgi:hypothetical protein
MKPEYSPMGRPLMIFPLISLLVIYVVAYMLGAKLGAFWPQLLIIALFGTYAILAGILWGKSATKGAALARGLIILLGCLALLWVIVILMHD